MPWKEHRVMSSKIEFVEKATRPKANIAALCREYGISRQTGYKLLRRYKARGYDGLEEESRRPKSTPLATAEEVVAAVLVVRKRHPRWGAKKLMVVLRRSLGEATPSVRTVHRLLTRFGRIKPRRAKPVLSIVERAPRVVVKKPNDLWTIDFKGWWRAGDGERCNPLTIRDAHSRFVLALELVEHGTGNVVRDILLKLFRRHGLPSAIQCDNGAPFISMQSMGGLTKLSAWWVSLGIKLVRSRPASPQDNGAHERMHVDVAGDLEADPEDTVEQQQRACRRWRQVFNHVRPHEALGQRTPAEVYKPSPRKYAVQRALFPIDWAKRKVGVNGNVGIDGDQVFISSALHGYTIALEPMRGRGLRRRVWFYGMQIGEVEVAGMTSDQLHRAAG
jgi:transposase InsO family protein